MSENIIAKFSTRFVLLIAAAWILTPVAASADPPEVFEHNPKYIDLRLEVGQSGTIEAGPDPYAEDGKPPYVGGKKVYHLDQNLVGPVIINAVSEDNGVAKATRTTETATITGIQVGRTIVYIKNRYMRKPFPSRPEDRERTVFVTVYEKDAENAHYNAGSEEDTRVGQAPTSKSDDELLYALAAIGGQSPNLDYTPVPPIPPQDDRGYRAEVPFQFLMTERNSRSAGHVPRRGEMPYLHQPGSQAAEQFQTPAVPSESPAGTAETAPSASAGLWQNSRVGGRGELQLGEVILQPRPSVYLHQPGSQAAEQSQTPAVPNESPAGTAETAPSASAGLWQNPRVGGRGELQLGGVILQPRPSVYLHQPTSRTAEQPHTLAVPSGSASSAQDSQIRSRVDLPLGGIESQPQPNANPVAKAPISVRPPAPVNNTRNGAPPIGAGY